MKGKNMILLSVAVLAIGLFVLPQTMAMFVGQHTWFSVRTAENEYDMCEKCHINEVAEWNANNDEGGAHSRYVAEYGEGCFCHQINTTRLEEYHLTDANSNISEFGFEIWSEMDTLNDSANWAWRPTTTPHAAVIVDCVDCHYNESQQIANTNSAHYAFWNQTKNAENTDNNTACMACHTHTHLNITWVRLSGINIVANHTDATALPYDAWDINVTINETLDYNTTAFP
ncbi:MAG: hypothetical protein C5S52_02690 [ANME-2 cluster archaeon]|nr:hypothetical protein [ANME-2 cluster archaeon]